VKTKKAVKRIMSGKPLNKHDQQLMIMYSAGYNAPTPYMTRVLAKARRRNKLARASRRRNR
jgi:hypothetical protein